jgi:hypothetical protein
VDAETTAPTDVLEAVKIYPRGDLAIVTTKNRSTCCFIVSSRPGSRLGYYGSRLSQDDHALRQPRGIPYHRTRSSWPVGPAAQAGRPQRLWSQGWEDTVTATTTTASPPPPPPPPQQQQQQQQPRQQQQKHQQQQHPATACQCPARSAGEC